MSKKRKKQQRSGAGPDQRSPLTPTLSPAGGEGERAASIIVPSPSAAAILEEGPEPTVGNAGFPVLLIALLALGIYLADAHMSNRGGEFSDLVYYPYANWDDVDRAHPVDPAQKLRRLGRQVYGQNCAACHQASGQGSPGQYPPLAGSEWVVGPSNRTVRIVLHAVAGPIDVAGTHIDSTAMPAWKLLLNDEQIAGVITFIRSEFGNKADPVPPELVKQIRDKEKARETPWSADELKKLPEKE